MSQVREKCATVRDLLEWLETESIPDHWVLRREDYGLTAGDPSGVSKVGFSLVPEDVEVECDVRKISED